jgi:hypothetical protein
MFRRRLSILSVLIFSLVVALPVLADAPGVGTVVEGESVPGISLGDTRAEVEESVGPRQGCNSTMASCTFDVDGGGWVRVRYQGVNGGDAAGSPDDVVAHILWNDEVVGWRTEAGITIEDIYTNKQLAVDTYPNAELEYEYGSLIRLTDYDLGISISWEQVYLFYNVYMSIFEPFIPPPPPPMIRVADIEMDYTRRSVTATVFVMDEQNQPVEDAVVGGYWVYPVNKNNNTTLFIDGTTANDGSATFRIDKARPGDYRITISYVTKEGFELDHDGSILVGRITKPK